MSNNNNNQKPIRPPISTRVGQLLYDALVHEATENRRSIAKQLQVILEERYSIRDNQS